MDKKTELRAKAKELRKTLDMAKFSGLLCDAIRKTDVYKSSENVMLFYPKAYETDCRSLLSDDKNFYLPRISGMDIEVCPYKSGDKLQKSEFGVLEPVAKSVSAKILDLVIVPALMADKNGYRLGYGGGFYDRFLAANSEIKTICALPKVLVIDELPRGEFDVKTDFVITM